MNISSTAMEVDDDPVIECNEKYKNKGKSILSAKTPKKERQGSVSSLNKDLEKLKVKNGSQQVIYINIT